MPTITRTWLAFVAVGLGLIHIALVVESDLAWGIVVGALGLAEFAWGVVTFARETVTAPRIALALAIAPVVAWPVLLVTGLTEPPALLPLGIATVFELVAAAILGRHLRAGTTDAPLPPPIARYLLALVAAAAVVIALTATALAATQAADLLDDRPGDLDTHGH